jgi:hypothetical protein
LSYLSALGEAVPFQAYPAELAPASADKVKQITLEVKDVNLQMTPGVFMQAWIFNGIHIRQGDAIQFARVNHGNIDHSIENAGATTFPAFHVTESWRMLRA